MRLAESQKRDEGRGFLEIYKDGHSCSKVSCFYLIGRKGVSEYLVEILPGFRDLIYYLQL